MRTRMFRRIVLLAIAAVLALAAPATATAMTPQPDPSAAGPASAGASAASPAPASFTKFRILQLNMCMWGWDAYQDPNNPDCFPSSDVNAQLALAAEKDQAVVDQVETLQPDALTLNEGCSGDIDAIVAKLHADGFTAYEAQSIELHHNGTCYPTGHGRGYWRNAVIAKGFATSTPEGGYFEAGGYRAWMCSRTTAGVRVCTAHLSLPSQNWGGYYHQDVECNVLDSKIRNTRGVTTIFAGDTNFKHAKVNCMPESWFGLQDFPLGDDETTPGTVGLQHIYYTPDLTRGDPNCGHVFSMPYSDHDGFYLDLYPSGSPQRGQACDWRDVRPAGFAPSDRELHGYFFHTQEKAGWSGPAAAALALTLQGEAYADNSTQPALAAELGTGSGGTPSSIDTMTKVLNDHMAADGGPRFYDTKLSPSLALLKSDMIYDFQRRYAIIARVAGKATDSAGKVHDAGSGEYIVIAEYDQSAGRLLVEDVTQPRSDTSLRRYHMSTSTFVNWISGGYTA